MLRESSKIDKTKLPVDAYEGWLKSQSVPPEKRTQRDKSPTDYYEEWLGQRVEAKERKDKAKHRVARA